MNWEALGAIGEIVGAAAVVITLFYLGSQIRQSNKQQKLESHRAMSELQIQVNRIFYNPEIARDIAAALKDWNHATADQQQIASQWLLDTTTHYQTLFQMWRANSVEDDFYLAEEGFLTKEALATDGGRQWWQQHRFMWSTSFVDRIELELSDEPSKYFDAEKTPDDV